MILKHARGRVSILSERQYLVPGIVVSSICSPTVRINARKLLELSRLSTSKLDRPDLGLGSKCRLMLAAKAITNTTQSGLPPYLFFISITTPYRT
ncbi:hypothetical protein PoB_003436900 [Plakobranchus ocellatus]|uniref:Uncharacterized protein n=1 Tax=Plakobranchus ocellatus TaxID=259542 RepID=A0AAV4AJF6_9GAST|nr:hypothetical protein PoB_003436900 [Plakobranchus ocellatus]